MGGIFPTKAIFRAVIASAALLLCAGAGPALALPVARPEINPVAVVAKGAYNSQGFRRCMRAKYGPRYFARVPRAHRWHMSQSCMA